MFKYNTYLEVNTLVSDDIKIGISLKSGIVFKLQECYCSFNRIVDASAGDVSEYLDISYYVGHKNDKLAKEKITNCLNLLVFIFSIPLDMDYIRCKEIDSIEEIVSNKQTKKIIKLEKIDSKINRFKKIKNIFFNILALHNKGVQYSYMDKFEEEAYLYFFKSIENIAKDYFEKEYQRKLKPKNIKINNIINSIFVNDFNIVYSDNKIDDLIGRIGKYLINIASEDIYSKISFLCNENKIKIDYNVLGDAVSLRNKIAHDIYIDMSEHSKEYNFIMNLSKEIIGKKYFNEQYKKICIKPRIDI